MKAVILAAGLGKRMSVDKPKCLLKIGNKSLLEHNIEKLKSIGIKEIAVVIGHMGEMIKEILGDSVTYFQQEKQLGTAHAILCAKNFIDEPYFLVMNGDIFFTDTLENFIQLNPPAIAAYWVDDTSRYGKLWIKNDKIVEIKEKVEKFSSGLINAGIYLLPREIFEMIKKTPLSPRDEYEITDTIQMLIKRGFQFKVYRLRGYWKDIAYKTDLSDANIFFQNISKSD
jgi:bifunctional UDP-N-acetylglucosamine pyrophosphorylase/glucosamine-1-phosphate N-acetyltransferase